MSRKYGDSNNKTKKTHKGKDGGGTIYHKNNGGFW